MKKFWVIILLLLSAGCAHPGPSLAKGPGHTISEVPFFAQEQEQCGPAALAATLNFYGRKATPEEIMAAFETPAIAGLFNLDLELYARDQGFEARSYTGSLNDLRQKLDQGRPLIVLLNQTPDPLPYRHFAVAIGYTDRAVILHSGRTPNLAMPIDRFLRQWNRTDCWTLLILPKDVKE